MEFEELLGKDHGGQHAADNHDVLDHSHWGIVRALRITLVVGFGIITLMALSNTYLYLIKQRMYRSFPLIVTYMITFAFCGVGIAYESSMMCGKNDCLYPLVKASEGLSTTDEEKDIIGRISLFWSVKQQLSVGLGLAQLVTIVALYLRMKNIVRFLKQRSPAR